MLVCIVLVDIYVANIYIGTLDTGTKYVESAEEEIAEIFKNVFKKLLGDKLTFKEVNE